MNLVAQVLADNSLIPSVPAGVIEEYGLRLARAQSVGLDFEARQRPHTLVYVLEFYVRQIVEISARTLKLVSKLC